MGVFGAEQLSRARFYDDLATTLDAGIGAREALSTVAARGERLGAAALAVEARVLEGRTLAEAMAEEPGIWSTFERRVIEAGERGGRLPATLKRLAQHFEQRGRARDRVGYGLLYPVGLVHAAFLLPPLKYVIAEGNPVAYAKAAHLPLAVLWGLVIGAFALVKAMRASDAGRRTVDTLLFWLPGVRGTVRSIALLEYSTTLGALWSSGIPAIEAMESAAAATRNTVVADAGRRAAERLRGGERMHEALAAERAVFPRILIEAVRLGETSGKLDETLARLERAAREEADRRVKAIATAVPVVAYLGVVLFIAYTVVSFWMGYVNQLRNLGR